MMSVAVISLVPYKAQSKIGNKVIWLHNSVIQSNDTIWLCDLATQFGDGELTTNIGHARW